MTQDEWNQWVERVLEESLKRSGALMKQEGLSNLQIGTAIVTALDRLYERVKRT